MKRFFIKAKDWFIRHKPSKRRLIQVYAALLYNANLKGFASGNIYKGNTKYLCVPGLNCYSCPGAVGACPLGALQNALASSGTKAPAYVFGIIILFGLLLGRTVCGFLCPVGLFQELVYKIKTPKLKKNKFTRIFSYFKYVLLVALAVAIPVMFSLDGTAVPGFCKYICPAGTLGGAVGLLQNPNNASMFDMLGPLFTWKFCVLVVFVVASVFIYRFFCRFFCPLGAIYGFFCRVALLGVKLDKEKCTDCGICLTTCKMDIKHVGDHECIQCGDCIAACPAKAIRWKGSKIFLHPNTVESEQREEQKPLAALTENGTIRTDAIADGNGSATVYMPTGGAERSDGPNETTAARVKKRNKILEICAWCLAVVVLAGALVYYNVIEKDAERVTGLVGTECPDFSLETLDGGETVTLSDYSGKVIVLNFWATWCGSCVAEIPAFETFYNDYSDDVQVVEIDTMDSETADGVRAFVAAKNWTDYNIPFVFDAEQENGSLLYTNLGGVNSLPLTVVVDRNGVIRYAQEGSLNYNSLVSLVTPYL